MSESVPLSNIEDWLSVIESDYLGGYISSGGAAVKFVSAKDELLDQVPARIQEIAEANSYYYAAVDSSKPSAQGKSPAFHRVDQFFFEVTRHFDWNRWAREQARIYLENTGLTIPVDGDIGDLEKIAQFNGRDPQDLINQYQREFATPQLKDTRLSVEFRAAITGLGRAQLIPDAFSPTTEEVLLEWFRGKSSPGAQSALKKVQIYERININNARTMLASFCRWLPNAGHSGLVILLDFRPYEFKRMSKTKRQEEQIRILQESIRARRSIEETDYLMQLSDKQPSILYSDSAYLQMLTMLRRFIDEIDTLDNMFLVVLTTPSFYKDKSSNEAFRRSYFDYDALQTRIGQEVYDSQRTNLSASLIHLGVAK